jgi:photosystem II stability/assembly factor-like uncharacterized protein
MKKPTILLLGTIMCMTAALVFTLKKNSPAHFETRQEAEEHGEGEEQESGLDKAMDMWFQSRAYPDPYYLDDKYLRGWEQAKKLRNQTIMTKGSGVQNGSWSWIGPKTGIGGRILNIAIDPTNNQKIFIGSAGSGIWKSTDAAATWTHVNTGFPVQGVTSIIINPSNANIIYAGTGEVYRYDSTGSPLTALPNAEGHNIWKARGTYSIGILKSTDGGTTWSRIFYHSLANQLGIQMLKFDPTNYNTIYACCTDGLYRSTDAGANWTNIFQAPYVSDVVINATNNQQIVCAVGNFGNTIKGIYRSTDGGTTFLKVQPSSGLCDFQSPTIPVRGFTRFDNLTSAGNENTIVASIGIDENNGPPNELYRSTDFGATWVALPSSAHGSYQFWCAHDCAINPFNTNQILIAGVSVYKYTLSSATSGSKGSAYGTIHSDIHDMKYDPTTSGTIYVACDGGIYKTTNGGTGWSAMNSGLGAVQFYASIGVGTTDANLIVGGLQDNGVVQYNGTSWSGFPGLTGTDGAACLVSPPNGATSDNNIIASGDARNFYYSSSKGSTSSQTMSYLGFNNDSRTAFVAPVAWSKGKPSIVYVGSDNLHKSTTGGSSWVSTAVGTNYIEAKNKTAIAMAVAPSDVNGNILYVSTSPFAQSDLDVDAIIVTGQPNVLKTTNGATPFTSILGTGSNKLPNRFIMDFAISATDPNNVYVAVSGFGTAHVYVTTDGGTNWTPLGASTLPDVPFTSVLIDPLNPSTIYAGGDMGVYVSPNKGVNWYDYNTGFPDMVQVMDIQANATNNLVVATHSMGVFTGPRYTGTLPVTLESFTGEAKGVNNQLTWVVDQEYDLWYYDLERSKDGTNFEKVTTINARNSTSQTTYSYNDPVPGNTSYYYRLKSVDRDKSYTYSNVIFISRKDAKEDVRVIGNPFTSALNIKLTLSQNEQVKISLFDAGGKLLKKEQAPMNAGQSMYALQGLDHLPAGVYYVEAIINNQRWKERVVKK